MANDATRKCVICNRKKREHLFYKREWNKKKDQVKCKSCLKKAPKYNIQRDFYLRTKYNIALSEYQKLLDEQDGRCYICRRKPRRRALDVDHNHAWEKERSIRDSIRGILCSTCNQYLGFLKDDQAAVFRMMDYLDRPSWTERKKVKWTA